ncbi:MAG: hypothetical protein JO030_03570 [Candidatus Eremiobacteraeota bacterium]|nr:hypothetical protein [Candidatus Eremiobacteraeota bacterium]
MDAPHRVPIADTHRGTWPGASPAGSLGAGDMLLTAWLRPKAGGELDAARAAALGATVPSKRAYADRAKLRDATTFDAGDVAQVEAYCKKFGLEIVDTHWRSVVLHGTIDNCVAAFGATAAIYQLDDARRFRHRSDALHAPPEIAAILRGVFGIHQWPRSHAIGSLHGHTAPLSIEDVQSRYAFPDSDASGQTVAILQLRGTFKADDFAKSAQLHGIPVTLPTIKRVDNAELTHGIETAKDVESAIDTQIVAALAPGARIVVYAAPDDERGVLDAIRTALFDEENRASILSISFGFPEYLWTPAALTILNELFTAAALLGVSVFCASGDNGAENDDGTPHVLAPASSPFAHACGGTQIGTDTAETDEIAWEKTGGGFSERFQLPQWQIGVDAAADAYGAARGRGVPDVAGNAMPGYPIVFESTSLAAGGTSAVAPMWSALAARLNASLGTPIGFFAPLLYGNAAQLFRDVTSGGNGVYRSGAGWNACTGLGVPIGTAIQTTLRAAG